METHAPVIEKVSFTFPLQVLKAVEAEGEFHIVGYAATTDFDLQGDVISEEALAGSAADLLKNSTVLLNHDLKSPIGRVTKVHFDRHGLLIDALISKTEPEIIQKIKEGVLNKFSIRGQVLEREKRVVPELGRSVNVIKRMTLVEVSLVSVPANPEARAIGWYVSKALSALDQETQGGTPMPEEQVVVEEVPAETPPAAAPAGAAAPATVKTAPVAAAPAAEPAAAAQPAAAPAEPAKPETAAAVLEKIVALGGEAKPLAEKVKALLAAAPAAPPTAPTPAAAAPKTVGKEELGKMIAGEVAKQVDAALKAVPTLRKGLVQTDAETEQLQKQFESLPPEKKLKVALALQHS
jgi:HK97 family phage prohead protease